MDKAGDFKQNDEKIVESSSVTKDACHVKEEPLEPQEVSLKHNIAEDGLLLENSVPPSDSTNMLKDPVAKDSSDNDVTNDGVSKNVGGETQHITENQIAGDNGTPVELSHLEEKSDTEPNQNSVLIDVKNEHETATVQPILKIKCEADKADASGLTQETSESADHSLGKPDTLPIAGTIKQEPLTADERIHDSSKKTYGHGLLKIKCEADKADAPGLTQETSESADRRLVERDTLLIAETVKQEPQTASGQIHESSNKTSGLSLLATQYITDSDSDDVCEIPDAQTYQNRVVEIDSDSDSSTSEVEVLNGPIDLGIFDVGHGEEDEEDNIRNSRSPKVKGEMHLEDLPPIQDLHITVPEEECTELGKIQSIIDQLVIVNSLPGTVPLDLDTVLFLEKGKRVLGEIFDVLGQVADPLYCVRFNSNKAVRDKGIEVGQTVYVAPRTQHTQFIILANLMKVRGSDASWENDIEPPEKHLDYSDDEEERTARRSIRNRNRPMDAEDEVPKRTRPGEPGFSNHAGFPPQRPHRGNYYGPAGPQPHHLPPSNYNNAGNSWHSNYYQNCVHPNQQNQHYRMPIHPPGGYRGPPWNMPLNRPPPAHPGLVLNPYSVFPPPQLMQQPLFPPPQQTPPPPPQGGFH